MRLSRENCKDFGVIEATGGNDSLRVQREPESRHAHQSTTSHPAEENDYAPQHHRVTVNMAQSQEERGD